MEYNEFSRYMTAIVNGMVAIKSDTKVDNKNQIERHVRLMYEKCVREMKDTYKNIQRWLDRKPCLFRHPRTGNLIKYPIGADIEALYYFLEWCRRLQNNETIDNDFEAYVAYVISRSMSNWEEC